MPLRKPSEEGPRACLAPLPWARHIDLISPTIKEVPMRSYSMMIAGRSVNTDEQDEVINPALGKPFATCARGRLEHVIEAVEAAAKAYPSWRKDEALRRQKLRECAVAVKGHAKDIAHLLSEEQGKPLAAAT